MLEEEVRRARREERDVEDVTVEGECLAGADLSGLEFRRVRLHRCRFPQHLLHRLPCLPGSPPVICRRRACRPPLPS